MITGYEHDNNTIIVDAGDVDTRRRGRDVCTVNYKGWEDFLSRYGCPGANHSSFAFTAVRLGRRLSNFPADILWTP